MILTFTIPGSAVSKSRPRVMRSGITFMPKHYVAWKKHAAVFAMQAAHAAHVAGQPWDAHRTAYRVTLRFYQETRRKVDIDNLAGAWLDSVNGVLFADDSAVTELFASKHWDKEKGFV